MYERRHLCLGMGLEANIRHYWTVLRERGGLGLGLGCDPSQSSPRGIGASLPAIIAWSFTLKDAECFQLIP